MQTRNKNTYKPFIYMNMVFFAKVQCQWSKKAKKIVLTSNANKILTSRIHTRNQINTLEIHSNIHFVKGAFSTSGLWIKGFSDLIDRLHLHLSNITQLFLKFCFPVPLKSLFVNKKIVLIDSKCSNKHTQIQYIYLYNIYIYIQSNQTYIKLRSPL